nr:MAG TPA: hypothetical protein [Caudoviricetes sp.]
MFLVIRNTVCILLFLLCSKWTLIMTSRITDILLGLPGQSFFRKP